jgi:hypothetical protein
VKPFYCFLRSSQRGKINPNQWSRWMGEAAFMKQQIEEKLAQGFACEAKD